MLMNMLLLMQRVRHTFNKTQWPLCLVISTQWRQRSRFSLRLQSKQETLSPGVPPACQCEAGRDHCILKAQPCES